MSKHTPGPYHVGGLLHNVKVSGYRIVGCGATVAIVVAGTGQAETTSNLFAAAPDLLAACKSALERIDGMNEAMGVVDELRSALAIADKGVES